MTLSETRMIMSLSACQLRCCCCKRCYMQPSWLDDVFVRSAKFGNNPPRSEKHKGLFKLFAKISSLHIICTNKKCPKGPKNVTFTILHPVLCNKLIKDPHAMTVFYLYQRLKVTERNVSFSSSSSSRYPQLVQNVSQLAKFQSKNPLWQNKNVIRPLEELLLGRWVWRTKTQVRNTTLWLLDRVHAAALKRCSRYLISARCSYLLWEVSYIW